MPQSARTESPPTGSRRALTGFLVVLTVAVWPAVVVGALAADGPSLAVLLLGLLVVASRVLPLVQFHRSREVQGVTFDEAVLVAILFAGGAGHVGVIFGLGAAIGHAIIRPTVRKVAFNSAQSGLAATLAAAAFVAIGPSQDVLAPRSVVAAAAATVIYAMVSHLLVAELFRRMHGMSLRAVSAGFTGAIGWLTAANLVLGLLLAYLTVTDVRAVALGLGVLVAAHIGFAGYAAAAADRHRARALQDATMTLVAAASGSFEPFLAKVAGLFSAGRAELILDDGEHVTWLVWKVGDVTRFSGRLPQGHPALDPRVQDGVVAIDRDTGDAVVTTLAAPILSVGARRVGTLVVADHDGVGSWGDQDAALLASLANDVAVALANVQLLRAVEQEREHLAEETAKLEDVMRATSDGIVVFDSAGSVTVWNAAMQTITGVSADEAVGRPWPMLLRLRDAAGRELVDPEGDHAVARALAGEAQAGVELQCLRRDGIWRWVWCSLNPIRSGTGGLRGVAIVARDITSVREVEQLKTDFIATMSHELRTPLTPLQGFIETLGTVGEQLDRAQRQQIVASMSRQVVRLRFLIDDLLLVADRQEGRARQLRRVAVNLDEAVEKVISGLTIELRSRVMVDAAPGIHGLGDHAAVTRIVDELIDNALRHTHGNVRVKVGHTGQWATVEVADDGPGIGQWDQEQVFRQFGRLGDHLHRPAGAGLGLPIARALARDLDGDLVLESDLGRGSRFRLQLPSSGDARGNVSDVRAGNLLPEA
jgi:PAS domain S-box-containing protein